MGRAQSTLGVVVAFLLALGGCESSVSPRRSEGTPHENISLNAKSLALVVGEERQLLATGATEQLTWRTDNPDVVSVSSVGLVSGLAPGTAHVVVRAKYAVDTGVVTVRPPVASVQFSADSVDIAEGKSATLAFRTFDAAGDELDNLDGAKIEWSSSAPSIATVDSTGRVSTSMIGHAPIVISVDGKSDTVSVRVVPNAIASITLNVPPQFGLGVGSKFQLSATAHDESGNDLSDRAFTWSTSDTIVAKVTQTGTVVAMKHGQVQITASSEGRAASSTLFATGTTVARVSVSLNPATTKIGGSAQATAIARDSAGNALADQVFTWTSSDPKVASIASSGVITAVSGGTTTITAASGGLSGGTSLTVLTEPPAAPTPLPPPSPDEPTYSSATGVLVFADSIDEYTTPHDMWTSTSKSMRFVQAFNENVDSLTLVTGRGGAGKALRMVYSGGYQNSHNWDVVNGPTLPDTITHFFSYYARVTVAGPMPLNGMPFKWFMAWHPTGNRVEWDTHDYLPCNVYPAAHTIWQVYDNGPTSCQGNQPVGPYPDNVFDGQWHRYTYQYRPNTRTGSRDGVARMWVDGIKVIDVSLAAAAVVPPGGYKPWCSLDDIDALNSVGVNYLRFGGPLTKETPAFTIDLDDFTWWHSE